ncbi:MAG: hypothetical protein KAS98_10720 [Deltaproteobacteria bacterium]|nr:hypothetical protein [Deltaproteobacteria bacterium]MCK5010949.1 hypothetical protein [Deltaproteobacteria bacterium]
MNFEDTSFVRFTFSKSQIKKHFDNALKDFNIAQRDTILDVKFNYTYTALIKAGIALISFYQVKVRSVPGHHVKIIEKMAEILNDETIDDIGNIMRSKRNRDFYGGGIEVTEKECVEYIQFVENVLVKIKNVLFE